MTTGTRLPEGARGCRRVRAQPQHLDRVRCARAVQRRDERASQRTARDPHRHPPASGVRDTGSEPDPSRHRPKHPRNRRDHRPERSIDGLLPQCHPWIRFRHQLAWAGPSVEGVSGCELVVDTPTLSTRRLKFGLRRPASHGRPATPSSATSTLPAGIGRSKRWTRTTGSLPSRSRGRSASCRVARPMAGRRVPRPGEARTWPTRSRTTSTSSKGSAPSTPRCWRASGLTPSRSCAIACPSTRLR